MRRDQAEDDGNRKQKEKSHKSAIEGTGVGYEPATDGP
jgi:hypothetical protein